jgi:coenzyme PQQ precursor peptide PqqA
MQIMKIRMKKSSKFDILYAMFNKMNIMLINLLEIKMAWTKPSATEMRFGFEVTMYVNNK